MTTYNVILTGQLIGDVDQDSAIAAFAKLFKLPADKAAAHFAKAPVAIKKSVDDSTAQKFSNALQNAGLHCKVELVKTQLSLEPLAQETPEPAKAASEQENQESQESQQSVQSQSQPQDTAPAQASEPKVLEQPGFKFEMAGQPDYGFVTVQVPEGETIKVEASAMATMDTNMRMKTKMRGGLSRLLTGESIFINEFSAEGFDGEIGIAPGTPGDLRHEYLDGQTIYLQNSAYVASGPEVEIETKWQGLTKGFFSGENLFLIRAIGTGDLWFNSYGAIIEIDVTDDYVVDTGNIVGFTEGLDYNITKVGGYKSLFFSGEGFVCRFSGKGKVWIQTRGSAAFVNWAHWFRPVKKK